MRTASAGNRSDFHRLDADAGFLKPLDGGIDFSAFTFEFKADDADFIRDTGLANIGYEFEFLSNLPDERLGDKLRRIHQPQPRFLLRLRGSPNGFLFGGHELKWFNCLSFLTSTLSPRRRRM